MLDVERADQRRSSCIDQVLDFRSVPDPVPSKIAKRVYRHASQDVCPYNIKFSSALAPDSSYVAREALGGKDGRTLARDILGMTQDEFSRAFSKSPMKRAKLRGLKRNAAVVLGNVGTHDDVDVLTRVLDDDDEEPLVHEHAAWALARLAPMRDAPTRPRP